MKNKNKKPKVEKTTNKYKCLKQTQIQINCYKCLFELSS